MSSAGASGGCCLDHPSGVGEGEEALRSNQGWQPCLHPWTVLSDWDQCCVHWAPAVGACRAFASSGCKRHLPAPIVPQEQGEVEKA